MPASVRSRAPARLRKHARDGAADVHVQDDDGMGGASHHQAAQELFGKDAGRPPAEAPELSPAEPITLAGTLQSVIEGLLVIKVRLCMSGVHGFHARPAACVWAGPRPHLPEHRADRSLMDRQGALAAILKPRQPACSRLCWVADRCTNQCWFWPPSFGCQLPPPPGEAMDYRNASAP